MTDKPALALGVPAVAGQPRPRPQRPNYRQIHRFPLPVQTHSVPSVIPHNPISLISVALSYLTFLFSPPRQEVYNAYFDPAVSAIHVTDERAIRALWEMGFFGKGSLSRSEPSWLVREKARRGQLGGDTSEEATRKRRAERRELKLERARIDDLIIKERTKAETAAREAGTPLESSESLTVTMEKFSVKRAMDAKYQELLRQRTAEAETNGTANGNSVPLQGQVEAVRSNGKTVRFSPVVRARRFSTEVDDEDLELELELEPENEEHLELSKEEALFLVYGLGALQLVDMNNVAIPLSSLIPLLCHHSYSPPRELSYDIQPDDPFLTSYVVYHHFRSLGWVVRSGVKFGTDYLLYNRGPVFSHAEFAVIIVPAYEHPYWSETQERKEYVARKQDRSWWWLHCVNRVQASVKKTLVICYVEVPPPSSSYDDVGAMLGRYRVREFLLRRWIANRSRD
ncbi:hypothetical protein N7470_003293 [Penicillium chermesinum]|nr:hypothetical protein N7470_003293 [Penicillium chermesinum]